jgi:peptidoglycan/LPS O-acetylase OafA/YrhL
MGTAGAIGGAGTAVLRRRRRRTEPTELGRVDALDGLRAVAVMAVLFFHARFDWIPGGFLGVSTFFTLSGFLITTLLLQEWNRTSTVSLRGFFGRRFRRLLPASWLTISLVLAMGALGVWTDEQLRSLRGDVPWALAELVNWHFIFEDRTYGEQFAAPSPIEHFWSLAVEQQFYLVLPVLVIGVLTLARLRGWNQRASLGLVLLLSLAGSAALNGMFAPSDVPRAYFGTDTRLAELAAGGVLACIGVGRLRALGARLRWMPAAMGVLGLCVSLFLWNNATVNSPWLYPWGLLITASSTLALVSAAVNQGLVAKLLSIRPVLWVGTISYGVYLLHWPVFLWLNPVRTGLSQWPLFGLRVAVTLTAAAVMFRLVEIPFREGRFREMGLGRRIALPAAVVLLLTTAFVTSDLPEPDSLAAAQANTTEPVPPRPTKVMFVGDQLIRGMDMEMIGTAKYPIEASVVSLDHCGLALGGWVQLPNGEVERDVDRCSGAKPFWLAAVEDQRPDVVVVVTSARDVSNRRLEPGEPWSAIGDPAMDDFLKVETRQFLKELDATSADAVVATVPVSYATDQGPAPVPRPAPAEGDQFAQTMGGEEERIVREDQPVMEIAANSVDRVTRWNALLEESAEAEGIPVVDLAGAYETFPEGAFDPAMRAADGVGLTAEGTFHVGQEIAQELREIASRSEPVEEVANEALLAELPAPPEQTPRRVADAGSDARILSLGDSVGVNVGFGLDQWAEATPGVQTHLGGRLGCPLARGGRFKAKGDVGEVNPNCEWATYFPTTVSESQPDVVVLTTGIWDVLDRQLPGDDVYRRIGEPEMDRYFLSELLRAVDALGADGATVVLTTYPHIENGLSAGFQGLPESDPARVDRLNELIGEAAGLRPGVARVIDLQGWLASLPGGEMDPAKRTDGVHFSDEFSVVVGEWLGPQLEAIARGQQ